MEFLALKLTLVDTFHDNLYGANCKVVTDNNLLKYVLTAAKLDAMSHRWLADLAYYNFSLQYRPGKQNTAANTLSRRSTNSEGLTVVNVVIALVNARLADI